MLQLGEAEKLRQAGFGQGFYWRKPAPPEEAAESLYLAPDRAVP